MPKDLGYQAILTSLFIEEDVPKSIALTVVRNESAYNYYKFVRQKVLCNNDYRHPQYLQRLRYFQEFHFSPQDDEWALIEDLYHSPLRYQYRVETSSKPYLHSAPDLDKALKQIRCVCEPFYDYKMPEHVVEAATERDREAREMKHVRAVTISDLQSILSKARLWQSQKENPWDLVACALFLCGRRVVEIVETLKWKEEPASPYLARVSGIAKQEVDDESFVIPLLCTFHEFDEMMTLIRAAQLPLHCHTRRLKPAFVRYFGQWYNHSQRRNIYGEAGFRCRFESGFFPEMSKVMWIDKALCHTSNVVRQAGNLTYQSLVFTDERDDRRSTPVSSPDDLP